MRCERLLPAIDRDSATSYVSRLMPPGSSHAVRLPRVLAKCTAVALLAFGGRVLASMLGKVAVVAELANENPKLSQRFPKRRW
eukprot:14778558-Alexandrium_andersonii.AAC.1